MRRPYASFCFLIGRGEKLSERLHENPLPQRKTSSKFWPPSKPWYQSWLIIGDLGKAGRSQTRLMGGRHSDPGTSVDVHWGGTR